MIGMYFHNLKDPEVILSEGRVISSPSPGWYLIKGYPFAGIKEIHQIVPIEKMESWFFYETESDVKFSKRSGIANEWINRKKSMNYD